MILLDTNLLGRLTDATDPQYATTRRAIHALLARRERLVIVPQNLYESWAVATRRAGAPPTGQNGLGMTPTQVAQWLRFFQRRFVVLPDLNTLLSRWQTMVETLGIKRFPVARRPARCGNADIRNYSNPDVQCSRLQGPRRVGH